MTKQEEKLHQLLDAYQIVKSARMAADEIATDFERKLADLYPPEITEKKDSGFQVSAEEKVRLRAKAYAKRGIPNS